VAKNALDAKFSEFKRARDLVQDFFAYLLQGNAYTHTNRRKSKFRWLLLASLKHYIADVWDPGRALKRDSDYKVVLLDEKIHAVEQTTIFRESPALSP
jgi:hypothetical protein